jgi:hypothetical protein
MTRLKSVFKGLRGVHHSRCEDAASVIGRRKSYRNFRESSRKALAVAMPYVGEWLRRLDPLATPALQTMKPLPTFLLTPLLIASFLLCQGCRNSPTPTQAQGNANTQQPTPTPEESSPQEEAAYLERRTQRRDTAESRLHVRQAVVDYVRAHMPQWKVNGVSLVSYTGNLYLAGVDASANRRQQSVNLVVRFYVADSGDAYWKAEPLDSNLAKAIAELKPGE